MSFGDHSCLANKKNQGRYRPSCCPLHIVQRPLQEISLRQKIMKKVGGSCFWLTSMYYIIIINNENYVIVHFSIFGFVPRELRAKCRCLTACIFLSLYFWYNLSPGMKSRLLCSQNAVGSWQCPQTHSVNILATNENKGKTFILTHGWDDPGHVKIVIPTRWLKKCFSFCSLLFALFLHCFPTSYNHIF